MTVKLDIGSGHSIESFTHQREFPDFITVDLYDELADVKADMAELPYQTGMVDEIWCSHALEHVGREHAKLAIREFWRVLRPGGKLTIIVPDFDWVAKYWLSDFRFDDRIQSAQWYNDLWSEKLIFGGQDHEGDYHKSAWIDSKLVQILEEQSFLVNSIGYIWDHEQQSIKAEATR